MRYDDFREEYEGYDVAQVCLNGHPITEFARSQPEHNQKFCGTCGAETIDKCPSCGHFIRGFYHIPGVVSMSDFAAPAFCYNCGKPYPWTETRIKAVKDLIAEAEKLKPEERESLSKSIDDLVRDTPRTQLAVMRFQEVDTKGRQGSSGGCTIYRR